MEEEMKNFPLLFCIAVAVAGCITSGPQNNVGFGRIEKLNALEGVYKNLGEGAQGAKPVWLSTIIWPAALELDDSSITAIEVRAISDTTIVVKALKANDVLKEATFVEGKDFELSSGRIRLMHRTGFSGATGGNPYLGPYYESTELGLDQHGHGKYREVRAAAGLAFLIVPLVGSVRDDVRFVRIEK